MHLPVTPSLSRSFHTLARNPLFLVSSSPVPSPAIGLTRVLRLQRYYYSSPVTMISSFALSAVPLLLAAWQAVTVGAVPTISAVGSKFFYENGTQYYIKGMADSHSHRLA